MYVIYFTGEYELDNEGNLCTRTAECSGYAEACAIADDWYLDTGNIATIGYD